MNFKLLNISVLALTVFNSCTKETTIKESYNPPKPGLYGSWRQVNNSTDTQYFDFPDDNSNFVYILTDYKLGYHTSSAVAYFASDKQLVVSGSTYNYDIKADTLMLYNAPGNFTKLIKVDNSKFNHKTWVKGISKLKTIDPPAGYSYSYHPFGINGDLIYPHCKTATNEGIYQFNTLTGTLEDSVAVSEPASTVYNSGNVYLAFDNGTYNIFKTDMNSTTSNSVNTIPYPRSISMNKSTGEIFVFNSNADLYKGSDGGTYSVATSLNAASCEYVQYYKDGEFLCLYNGALHKILPGLTFKVTASYDVVPGLSVYSFSTNGDVVWLYGYDSMTSKYKLVKVSLN